MVGGVATGQARRAARVTGLAMLAVLVVAGCEVLEERRAGAVPFGL